MTASLASGQTSFARRVRHAVVGNLVGPLGWIIALPILSRTLGVDGRGEVAAAVAPLLLATTLGAMGLPETLVFVSGRHPRNIAQARRFALLITLLGGLAATVTVYVCAPLLAQGRHNLESLIRLASLALLPTLVIGLERGLAMGRQDWARVRSEQSIAALAALAGVAALAAIGQLTATGATCALAFGPLLGGLVYITRSRSLLPGDHETNLRTRDMLRFAMQTWTGGLTGIALARLDQVIMIPLSSSRQLGLYVLAVNISEIPLILNSAVSLVSYSAEASDEDHGRLVRSARISSTLCAVGGAIIALSLPIMVPLIFGADFSAAIPATLILLLAVVGAAPGSMAGAGLAGRGRPGLRSLALVAASAFNVVLLLVLVPPLGALGAALATLGGNLVASTLVIAFYAKINGTSALDFWGFRRSDLRQVRAALATKHGASKRGRHHAS